MIIEESINISSPSVITMVDCEATITKIIKFLEPNKHGFYKVLRQIDKFINYTLSCHQLYSWNYHRTPSFRQETAYNKENQTDPMSFYTNYRVFVYFPLANIRVDIPLEIAQKISVIKHILKGEFKEKAIKIKFYDQEINTVVEGPLMCIVSSPIQSLLFDNGESFINRFCICTQEDLKL